MADKLEFLLVLVIAIIALVAIALFVKAYVANSLIGQALFNTETTCVCDNLYEPVCGSDRNTYMNSCIAKCNKREIQYTGYCASS